MMKPRFEQRTYYVLICQERCKKTGARLNNEIHGGSIVEHVCGKWVFIQAQEMALGSESLQAVVDKLKELNGESTNGKETEKEE